MTLSAAPGVLGTSDRQLIPMQKKQPHVIGQPPDRTSLAWSVRLSSRAWISTARKDIKPVPIGW